MRAAAWNGQIRPPAAARAARHAATVQAKPGDEAEPRDEEPAAVGAGERVERRGDAAAEEAGGGGDGREGDESRRRDGDLGA